MLLRLYVRTLLQDNLIFKKPDDKSFATVLGACIYANVSRHFPQTSPDVVRCANGCFINVSYSLFTKFTIFFVYQVLR